MCKSNDPIMARYSCRSFRDQPVEKELILRLIEAGMQAPSAHAECPWEFYVVTSEKGRVAVAEASPYGGCCKNAAAVILVCANMTRVDANSPWWVQDMSACVENILIEAVASGLGGVWLGMYPRDARVHALRRAFSLPEAFVPFAAVPIGYPAEEKVAQRRFDLSRICWEDTK